MRRCDRWLAAAAFLTIIGAAAPARHAIAVFDDWGAFRVDALPVHCMAMAEPPPSRRAAAEGAFVSVTSWPARRIRAQLSARLSHVVQAGAPVTLVIGDSGFPLEADGRGAWAHDRREDADIVAAMRAGSSMSIAGVAADGTPFADGYRLRGAASAIDAAMLACPLG